MKLNVAAVNEYGILYLNYLRIPSQTLECEEAHVTGSSIICRSCSCYEADCGP